MICRLSMLFRVAAVRTLPWLPLELFRQRSNREDTKQFCCVVGREVRTVKLKAAMTRPPSCRQSKVSFVPISLHNYQRHSTPSIFFHAPRTIRYVPGTRTKDRVRRRRSVLGRAIERIAHTFGVVIVLPPSPSFHGTTPHRQRSATASQIVIVATCLSAL